MIRSPILGSVHLGKRILLDAFPNSVRTKNILRSLGLYRCWETTKMKYPKYISAHRTDLQIIRFISSDSAEVPLSLLGTAASKVDTTDFMSVFPDIVRDLTVTEDNSDVPYAKKWLSKVLQYNVPRGKKNRGISVVLSYRLLIPPEKLTPENVRLSQIMGWCVELLHSFILVADDIMDYSETRRGSLCWYRKEDVGLSGFNDSILIEACMYKLLKKYFSDKSYYVDILELFHEVTMKTSLGQLLDLHSTPHGKKPQIDLFDMDRYSSIVKYKTAYYSFHLPVALAMKMAGIRDPEVYRQAQILLLEMGQFFQVQDDFLDCYGEPSLTGKKGTDIQDGKCSWLIVMALQRSNPQQKMILKECYGSSDPEKIALVKQVYDELNLTSVYAQYEENSYRMIQTHIQQTSRGLPHKLFFMYMNKIYKRQN